MVRCCHCCCCINWMQNPKINAIFNLVLLNKIILSTEWHFFLYWWISSNWIGFVFSMHFWILPDVNEKWAILIDFNFVCTSFICTWLFQRKQQQNLFRTINTFCELNILRTRALIQMYDWHRTFNYDLFVANFTYTHISVKNIVLHQSIELKV